MASLALAVAGSAVGGVFGGAIGAQIGYAVGSIAGSLLFPAKGQKVEGPRLQDLQIQSSAEGAPIAQTYGSVRIAGNVIWGKPLSEHRHKEKSGGKGGGGGATSVSYTYTADFAIALCEGPIDAVRKIWADGKLIYDVSEPTAAEEAIVAGGGYLADRVSALQASLEKTVKGGGTMRIYLGSETQLPDPLIEADLGAGSAPAFRGTAYLIFDNLALEDFGNRIPNITVEVVTGTSGIAYLGKQGPFEVLPMPSPLYQGDARLEVFSHYVRPADTMLVTVWGHHYSNNTAVSGDPLHVHGSGVKQHSPRNTAAGDVPILMSAYCDAPGYFCYGDSTRLNPLTLLYDTISALFLYDASSTSSPAQLIGRLRPAADNAFAVLNDSLNSSGVWSVDGEVWVYIHTTGNVYRATPPGAVLSETAYVEVPVYANVTTLVAGAISSVWVGSDEVYVLSGSANPYTLTTIDRDAWTVSETTSIPISPTTSGGLQPAARLYSAKTGVIYIYYTDSGETENLYVVEDGVGRAIGVVPSTFANVDASYNFGVHDGILVVSKTEWAVSTVGSDPTPSLGEVRYWSIGAIGTSAVTLSTIVSDICESAGLESGDINVTDLASVSVKGYLRANQMTARAALEPLSQAYRFDATESDGVLKFVRRGTASVATLTADDFALSGDQDGPHVTTLQQDNELPIELSIRYMDVDRDYQSGAQRARRLAPDSQQTATVELPVVLTGSEAKQSAEVLQYLAWTERTKYQFALRPQHIKLDAGDIVTVPIGGTDRRLRLTQVTLADVLACEAVADDASVYVSAAAAAATTSAQQTVYAPGATIPAFMDIPILRDADDDADFYLAAVGTGTGWTGAAVYKSADRADWSRIDAVTEPSVIGACTTLMPTGPTTIFDDGSTVNVRLASGTLSSVTEAQMCNGANAAAIGSMSGGWEIVGFQNATLQGDGTYLLSRFLRGRRGTEWAVGTHAIGDQFVLLESGDLIRPDTAATEINSARYYKLPSFGTHLTDAAEITYTHQAAGKKPLSPVHISGRRHAPATNDWTVSWVRRGRLDWEWRDYVETPLGEATESYEIDIMSGSTVKRTLTASTQSVTYTAAQQTTDFGGVQTTLSVRVYQMSATVGRGYVGTATL